MPFLIMAISTVMLAVVSQILIVSFLKNIKADGDLATLISKQRTLSQEIVKVTAADNLGGILTGESVDSLMQTTANYHRMILRGDSARELQPLPENFFPAYKRMNTAFNNFIDTLIKAGDDEKNPQAAFISLINSQQAYSKEIDNLISLLDKHFRNDVEIFELKEIVIIVICIVIVFLEAVFIFLPAVKKIQKQNEQLAAIAFNHSHLVRSPLCNVLGILSLIDETKVDKETKELLRVASQEAQRLDNIIKKNVLITHEK